MIDGVPAELIEGRGLDFLSAEDVARIVVLKDPAETSIYDIRRANGVVVITTKQPR